MLNTKYVFRCIRSQNLYKPEFMYDVEGMRKHPEYEEVDEQGNVINRNAEFEAVQRPLMHVEATVARGLKPSVKAKK